MKRVSLIGFLFLLSIGGGLAQLPYSDMQQISPAMGRAGETVDVALSGSHLESVEGLRFNETRITSEPIRLAPDAFFPEGKVVPNRFRVALPADLKPGVYEVRSQGYFGLSTARPFMVLPADANEVVETGDLSRRESAMELPVETGVSGRVDGQRIDWFRFAGKKDERLFIEVWGERLDSRLDGRLIVTDAAGRELESNRQHFGRDPFLDFIPPVDGEYFLGLSDILYRGGSEYFYRLLISRRPHIDFVFPPAGQQGQVGRYTLFGRNLPGGSLGEGTTLDGKPLETLEVEIALPTEPTVPLTFSADTPRQALLPAHEFRLPGSNAVKIGFASAPVVIEREGADPVQTVEAPCEIAGRFDADGDSDTFRFSARKGVTYWIETVSERLTVGSDPVLMVSRVGRDAEDGETLTPVAENDDPPTFFSANRHDATNADTNDAVLSFTADEDAVHEVRLINNLASGSVAHLYRLTIREAAPDFQLITTTEQNLTATNGRAGFPAAPLVRRGGSIAYRVIAPRRDGFDGDIVVSVEGLPDGVSSDPLILSGGTDTGFLTATAAESAGGWSGPIRVVGRAQIDGKTVERDSRNASLVWGFIFSDNIRVRTRLDLETVLSVSAGEIAPALVEQAEPGKVWEVEMGQKLEIPVRLADRGARKGNLTVQPHGFPGMLRNPPSITLAEGKNEGVLAIDMKSNGNFALQPGRYQFVLQGIGIAKYAHHLDAVAVIEAEKVRVEKWLKEAEGKLVGAKAAVTEAEGELEAATANAAAASEAAQADVAKRVEAAEVKVAEARKALADTEALAKTGAAYLVDAEKAYQAAVAKAKESDIKFATFSRQIPVVVTAPVEKP